MSERKFEMQLEINAPTDAVWKALTDGTELARWFPLNAKVKPGVGGSIWLSWGEGAASGEAPITIWEPRKHFQWQENMKQPWSGGTVEGPGPWLVSIDFYLAARAGGGTVLRLVHSGFGRGRGWDDDLDSISNGWKFEVRSLRHYLERHAGKPRTVVYEKASVPITQQAAHALLMGPRGLGAAGSTAGLKEGDRYRLTSVHGDVYEGEVRLNVPGRTFVGTVDGLGDGLIRAEVERWGDKAGPFIWIAAWGDAGRKLPALRAKWRATLDELFAVNAAS